MNIESFRESLNDETPPANIPPLLRALWHDANGDWEAAHHVAQDVDTSNGSWIHAYLHRKEGDVGNADYWYRRAGKKRPSHSFDDEWRTIVAALLDDPSCRTRPE